MKVEGAEAMSGLPARRPGGDSSYGAFLRRIGPGVRLLIVSVLLLPLVACATKRDVRDLQEEMRAVAERQHELLVELERLHWMAQDTLRQQSRNFTALRGELNQRILDVQDQVIELQALTGQSQQVLAGLRDQLETQRRQVTQPAQQSPWDWEADDPGGVDPGGAGAAELYNAAVTQFNRGALGTATRRFEEFLERFSGHRLAPDARYFLADILAQEGRTGEAIDAFLRIQELHPTASRVPEALYRVGVLYLEDGDSELAEEYLERVVNTYPDTEAAERAEERLQDLP